MVRTLPSAMEQAARPMRPPFLLWGCCDRANSWDRVWITCLICRALFWATNSRTSLGSGYWGYEGGSLYTPFPTRLLSLLAHVVGPQTRCPVTCLHTHPAQPSAPGGLLSMMSSNGITVGDSLAQTLMGHQVRQGYPPRLGNHRNRILEELLRDPRGTQWLGGGQGDGLECFVRGQKTEWEAAGQVLRETGGGVYTFAPKVGSVLSGGKQGAPQLIVQSQLLSPASPISPTKSTQQSRGPLL